MDTEYATKVAKLNDAFRRSGLGVTVTEGVQNLGDLSWLLCCVQWYNGFTEDNDPYHEHDFGSVTFNGEKVFWKISYYDQSLKYYGDPLSAECKRVLTIMLAEEY